MIRWINFLHLYQPPFQAREIVQKVSRESYDYILGALEQTPLAKITINVSGSLIEHLLEEDPCRIIQRIRALVQKKQIELTGSACYHPILPLLPVSEARRQIQLNENFLLRAFGGKAPLRGFYLPEMAYSLSTAKIIQKFGFRWILLDEISLGGAMGKSDPETRYEIRPLKLAAVFRNRILSKTYVPETILKYAAVQSWHSSVVTATDGELYGHHHNDFQKYFIKSLRQKNIQTLTLSEYLRLLPKKAVFILPKTSSWETTETELKNRVPFALWNHPKNSVHAALWKMIRYAIRVVRKNKKDQNYLWAQDHLDRALASCTSWWASEKKPDVFSPISWNPDEIEKGLKSVITSVRSLQGASPKVKLEAENLYQSLLKKIWTRHWKKYGQKRA